MARKGIGIVIEGATGRLGSTQHLRSLMAMSGEGGLLLANGDRLVPQPVLLGRDSQKLAALAAANAGLKWSTDRDACLGDPGIAIYFDATATGGRSARVRAALDAGKQVYVEKPLAETLAEALDLTRRAERTRPTVLDVVVTRDPARMLPAVDNRTVEIKQGDRVA